MRCLVVQAFHDGIANVDRRPGEFLEISDPAQRSRWLQADLIKPVGPDGGPEWPWEAAGRELRVGERRLPAPARVVACINVWNDAAALDRSVPSWLAQVDQVVAVDGAYVGVPVGTPGSTDRTLEVLDEACIHAGVPLLVHITHEFWPDQISKRNVYLDTCREGDLLFVVDADEVATFREGWHLRDFTGDVGWVRIRYPQYRRAYDQPRLFRWREGLHYRGRHHWLWHADGPLLDLVATHQNGGVGFAHRLAPVELTNLPDELRPPERRAARITHRQKQATEEGLARLPGRQKDALSGARETLRILQLGSIDPGLVAYRLHTALNATTPHASVFGRHISDNPFHGPHQFDLHADAGPIRYALKEADVVHCHVDYHALDALGVDHEQASVVIHHHGTVLRREPGVWAERDKKRARLRLVSNLELTSYGADLRFLPNPVPFADYADLGRRLHPSRGGDGIFRVAHSPSKRELKGTQEFLLAIDRLQRRGVPIEAVLIEGLPHGQALTMKAACDAVFDSFWLGMQCSGIEGAAMGLPVLAGDAGVAARARAYYGEVPWTLTEDPGQLQEALGEMVANPAFRMREQERVTRLVRLHHDEAAVALRYLDLLDDAIGWRAGLTIGQPAQLTHITGEFYEQ